jgi:hypothetical protein
MDYHHHARLTMYSREHLAKDVLEGRLRLCEAVAEYGKAERFIQIAIREWAYARRYENSAPGDELRP